MDRWILRRAERFAHGFQRLTGRSVFFLLSWTAALVTLYCLLMVLQYWFPGAHEHSVFPPVDLAMTVLTSAVAVFFAGTAHAFSYWENTQADVLPPGIVGYRRAFEPVWMRCFYVVLGGLRIPYIVLEIATGDYVAAVEDILFLALPAFSYLVHVDPLPPCRGRIREWLAGLSFRWRPAPTSP